MLLRRFVHSSSAFAWKAATATSTATRVTAANGRSICVRSFASHSDHGDHGKDNGGHHGPEPHVPEFYDNVGKAMMVVCFFWIFYRFKQDGAQLFGFYKPWLHPHEHDHDDSYWVEQPERPFDKAVLVQRTKHTEEH